MKMDLECIVFLVEKIGRYGDREIRGYIFYTMIVIFGQGYTVR